MILVYFLCRSYKPPEIVTTSFAATRLCITASRNISANGNVCFRVFQLQLKVISKNICHLYSVHINQIALFISKFLAIYYLSQNFQRSVKDRVKIKHQLHNLFNCNRNNHQEMFYLKMLCKKLFYKRCSTMKFSCSGQNPQQRPVFS